MNISSSNKPSGTYLDEVIQTSRKALKYVLLFSFGANIMMLALPIYSLQILERVPASGSVETLVMLSLIAFLMIVAYAMFQLARSLTLIKLGRWFDEKMSSELFKTTITQANLTQGQGGSQNLRDMGVIKTFLTGPGLSALFDAPWSVIYFLVIFLIHPLLFFISLIGGLLLLFAAILNERATNKTLGQANEESVRSMQQVDASARNAEVIEAMGMTDCVVENWQKQNQTVVGFQTLASDRSALITTIARSFRMLLQILVMGAGIALVLDNQITLGGVIACSILSGRALAPFEQAIGAWNQVAGYRKSLERLKRVLAVVPKRLEGMSLPAPDGRISAEKVIYGIPGTNKTILKGISFELNAGDILGVIGPSAAGKSTLAKLMVGIWKPASGNVRLDGADVYSWNRREFGKYVGYMPQDVELFEGTVRDNIARMQKDAKDEDIVAAAKMTGVHDMILHLPQGYETPIGPGGSSLSAGQRQRIGLARAFYGNPKFIVLDEPNSNLDESGEAALSLALRNAKSLKITTVVIAHRPAILSVMDKILVLKEGMVTDFGPAADIIAKYGRARVEGAAPPKQQIAQEPAKKAEAAKEEAQPSQEYSLSATVQQETQPENPESPEKTDEERKQA